MLNKIGFFQIDNLIGNRVPFLFFNMSESLIPWYNNHNSLSKMHLETYEIMTTPAEIDSILEAKKAPKDYAIVLLCADGTESLEMYGKLQEKAYTNVYVVDGGYQQMMTDKSQI